jgi:hypothetical protein
MAGQGVGLERAAGHTMSVALALNSSKEIWPSPSVSYLAISTPMRSERTSVKEPALTSRLDTSAICSKACRKRNGDGSDDGSGSRLEYAVQGLRQLEGSPCPQPPAPSPPPAARCPLPVLPHPDLPQHLPQLEGVDLTIPREAVHPVEDVLPQHQGLALTQVGAKCVAERIAGLCRAGVRVRVGWGARAGWG